MGSCTLFLVRLHHFTQQCLTLWVYPTSDCGESGSSQLLTMLNRTLLPLSTFQVSHHILNVHHNPVTHLSPSRHWLALYHPMIASPLVADVSAKGCKINQHADKSLRTGTSAPKFLGQQADDSRRVTGWFQKHTVLSVPLSQGLLTRSFHF